MLARLVVCGVIVLITYGCQSSQSKNKYAKNKATINQFSIRITGKIIQVRKMLVFSML